MSQMQKILTPKVESQKNSNLKDSLWLHKRQYLTKSSSVSLKLTTSGRTSIPE